MQRRAMANADACRADDGGKRGHRRHGSNPERGDVADGSASRRECQGGQYPEKMRAARDAVQNPHAERRVSVSDAPRPRGARVDVYVVVMNGAMVMGAGRNVQRASKRPEADADERHTNNPFAPRGENVDRRQQIAQHDCDERHDDDARSVAEPPRPACKPPPAAILDRERSDGNEMVRSREYVK